MSLSARIASFEPAVVGGKCRVCETIKGLPEDERAALQGALEDKRISNSALSNILKAEGYEIGESTVRRHRRAECKRIL
jgi:hypothetical protein